MYPSMMRKLSLFILSAASLFALGACADTQPTKTAGTDPGVSAIPWDRPEKWETGSNLPGAEFINSQ